MKPEVEKRNFKVNEFAGIYGVGRTKTYQEIRAGRLKAFKVGKCTLISREAAEAWQSAMANGLAELGGCQC